MALRNDVRTMARTCPRDDQEYYTIRRCYSRLFTILMESDRKFFKGYIVFYSERFNFMIMVLQIGLSSKMLEHRPPHDFVFVRRMLLLLQEGMRR
jgi:hypothetical protein